MKFDNILSDINGFGKFQIQLVLIQVLSRITVPCHFLLNNFMAAIPSHHCNISALDNGDLFKNLTLDQQLTVSVPLTPGGSPSSCMMYSKPQYQYLSGYNSTNKISAVECLNGWVFDNSTFKSTIATEWDLVCHRKGMNKSTATIFFIGVMFGAPLFGYLSDRFGRRRLLLVSYLCSMTFAILSAFSSSYAMFCVMRFFTGMSLAGISIISIVLNVEWFSIEHRAFSGVIISLDWTVGNWLLALLAYLINEWRMLILVVTSPLVLAIFAWRWLPESARWLMANGKADEAHHYIKKCAEMNNRAKCLSTITPTVENSFILKPETRIYNSCKCPRFGLAFTYYGISLNITGFGLNPYLAQFTFGSIEMPMKVGVYFFLEKIGRKPGEIATLLTTGLCLFINIFVPRDKWVARTVVAVLGKAMSEASFTIAYLYTTELYPTVVRLHSLYGSTGRVHFPLIILLEDVWYLLPSVIYCAVAVSSGLMAFLLPETLNRRLPEFIEDIDKPSDFIISC
uniref:Solute carrier family 22 member 7b, tandem duplicate 1 n=1 Tax=Neogobius melanostomus TaxID=47308 RepID=A0A8C6U2H8_9GOBI